MIRNSNEKSVSESLLALLANPVIKQGDGKVQFTSADRKRTGAIFLKDGKVNSIQIKNHPVRIYTRVIASGILDYEHQEELVRKYGRDQENPSVVAYLEANLMLTASVIDGFLKEHFLGVWDDLFAWRNAKAEWKPGATPDFTMPYASPDVILGLGEKRLAYLGEVAEEYTIEVSDLYDLQYTVHGTPDVSREDIANIVVHGRGEYSARDLTRILGFSMFESVRLLHSLFVKDEVSFMYDHQVPIKHGQQVTGISDAPTEIPPLADDDEPLELDELGPEADPEVDEAPVDAPMPELEEADTAVPNQEEEPVATFDEVAEVEPVDEIAELDEPEEDVVPPTAATADEGSLDDYFTGLQSRLSGMRETIANAATQMGTCDAVITEAQDVIAQQQAAIEEAQAARNAWEAEYDRLYGEYQRVVKYLKTIE